jgi:hypothetical protein
MGDEILLPRVLLDCLVSLPWQDMALAADSR